MADMIEPRIFGWHVDGRVATITLNRPERKNPLTFESYAELTATFARCAADRRPRRRAHRRRRQLLLRRRRARDHRPARRDARHAATSDGLLRFTRMTGDLVKAMRACPQPIVAAIDGICAGAGAILAMASDLRLGTARSRVAFLFVRVGLSGADMGACAILPRIIGQGRASELLYTGRVHGRRRGRALGLLQSAVGRRRRPRPRRSGARAHAGRRPDLRPRDDQALPARGMEHERRRGDRSRGRGAGDVHADGGFRARVSRFVAKQPPVVRRRTDVADRDRTCSTGRSSTTRIARWRATLAAWRDARAADSHDDDRSGSGLPRLRRAARRGRLAASTPCPRAVRRRARDARRALALPDPRDARLRVRARRVRVRDAGTRLRADLAVRLRRAQASATCPGVATRRARSPRSRSRRPTPARTSPRCRRRPAATAAAIVIDGEKTWISNAGIADYYVVFCRWPEGGDRSFIALVVDADNAGPAGERDDRGHRAASAWAR